MVELECRDKDNKAKVKKREKLQKNAEHLIIEKVMKGL
jgi:hypothetical protein